MSRTLPQTRTLFVFTVLSLMAAVMPLGPAVQPAQAVSETLVINEVDYDQPSTDAAEFVEIKNVSNTAIDLAEFHVVMINGSTDTVYEDFPLPAETLAPGEYFVLCGDAANVANCDFDASPDTNLIQNGAPDAVAILQDGAVIDTVSYEGDTGDPYTEGSGLGLEDDPGDADHGISRCPDGLDTDQNNQDFVFTGITPGATNDCETTEPPTGPSLVVNEVDYDQPGVDDAEFVEIKNVSDSDVNLSDYQVELVNGSGNGAAVYDTVQLPEQTLEAGGYFVICAQSTVENCDLQEISSIQNGAPDAVAIRNGDGIVDTVSYEGDTGDPYTEGSGDGLVDVDSEGNGISRCPDGSDTDQNNQDFVFTGITPGATNNCETTEPPAEPSLVVNELDYNQPSTDDAEFVEIKNVSDAPVDLDQYRILMVNGSTGSPYQDFALPAETLAAGEYFVLCGDAANVANCDHDVSPNTNLIQNGDPDAVAIVFEDGTVIDTVSYGGDTDAPYTEGSGAGLVDPATEGIGISRCPDGEDTDQNNEDFGPTDITPGATNDCGTTEPPPPFGACGDPATLIHEVQGDSVTSPLEGQQVVVEGIVVGDFQNNTEPDDGELGGFYLQEEDAETDGNPATSEGIFVFHSDTDVVSGQTVRAAGEVTEFGSGGSTITELSNVTEVEPCGDAGDMPGPTSVGFPVDDPSDLEAYEGMLTVLEQDLVISEYFNYDRFGEIVLTLPFEDTNRPFQPTAVLEPGGPAIERQAEIERRRITLDDGLTAENPDFTRHPDGNEFTLNNRFRGGDIVSDTTGVMDHSFGLYRIQPTEGADYTAVNPRPEVPDDVGGNLTVASFNVLNYFLSFGGGCGPDQNQDCRGADNQEEFDRQRKKILAALATIEADVFGLIEMENTTGVSPLQDIVDGLNAELGSGTYDYIDTGTIGGDAIKVGIIYKPASVTPLGDYAVLDESVDPRFLDDKNRPVLAQSFTDDEDAVFTVAVNHLKSKGSSCDDVGDPDTGDGQANCNGTRTAAAEALVDWLADDPTGSGDSDALIIGDLNSYAMEDPIDAVRMGPDDETGTDDDYTDLVREYVGERAYSYVFDGLFGYLDHALSNATMTDQVTGTTVWHINADEPDILDYDTTFKSGPQAALYEPNAYRSSDHDPVIVGLDANAPPVCGAATASQTRLFPPNHQFVPITVEGVTDPEDNLESIVIDSIFQDEAVDAPDSGNTAPDGRGVGTDTAEVRAERVGDGNGRTYHISFTATDSFGDSCSGTVQVGVPVGIDDDIVDDGPQFDSTLEP